MFAAEVCVCGSLSSFHQREFNGTLSAVKHWALSCAGKRLTLRLKTSEDVCPLLKWLSSLSITSHASSVSLQKIRFLKLIFFLLLRLPQCSFISFFLQSSSLLLCFWSQSTHFRLNRHTQRVLLSPSSVYHLVTFAVQHALTPLPIYFLHPSKSSSSSAAFFLTTVIADRHSALCW